VKRLTELGFTVGTTGAGMTLLRKEGRRVIVPHVAIEPDMLRAILRSAGVSEKEFFLNVTRSGIYAKTDAGPAVTQRKTNST
jgi:hypothetical protein